MKRPIIDVTSSTIDHAMGRRSTRQRNKKDELEHRRRQERGLRSFLDPEIQGARDAGQTHLDPPRAGRSAGRGERPGIHEITAVDLNIRSIADGEQGLAAGDLARLIHIRHTARVRPRIAQRLRGPREIRDLKLK